MVFDWLREGRPYSAFGWITPARTWRLYANVSGLLASGLLFSLALAGVTSGTGAVFKVDGPAASDKIEIRAGVPTIRVPLGGKLEFDMQWHVVEGGCVRYMTRTFTRVSVDDPYTLSARKRAPSHAVGRPGTDHASVELPPGISPGLWLYTSVADAECPQLGRRTAPVVFASLQVEVYDPDAPVMAALAPPVLATPVVGPGGPLGYRLSWERTEATPSEVFNTYSSVGDTPTGTPDVVIERRPALNRPVGRYTDVDILAPLPEGVHAGRWRLRQVIISTRPGGRTRVDPLFEIEFTVAER